MIRNGPFAVLVSILLASFIASSHITQTTDPLVASVSAVAIAFTVGLMLLVDRLYGLDRLLIGESART